MIGDARVELDSVGRVSAPGAPNLAGSALAMHNAVANTVRFTGLSLSEVLPMASTLPARFLGIEPVGRVTAEWDQDNWALVINEVR
jgi:N-acetylglucosamine-6-phosphate deacetylase